MKVFASDLDQTLIYSNRWVENCLEPIQCVEIYKEKPLSFMLKKSLALLQEINEAYEFVPVTTRTKAQYERIDFPFSPKIAIVANGGIILKNGEVDLEWEGKIKENLKACAPIETIGALLDPLKDKIGIISIRSASDLFFYIVNDIDVFDHNHLAGIEKTCKDLNWSMHDQGKKIYFVPDQLTKGRALAYIKKNNQYKHIVAAGDSELDESMKSVCDYFIVPGHSKLVGNFNCLTTGIDSGYEILKESIRFLKDVSV